MQSSSMVHRPCIYIYIYINSIHTHITYIKYTHTHIYIFKLFLSNFRGLYSAMYVSFASFSSLVICFMSFSALFSVLFVSVVVSISAKCVLNRHLVGVGAQLPSCFACGYTPRNSACHCTIPQSGR